MYILIQPWIIATLMSACINAMDGQSIMLSYRPIDYPTIAGC